MIVINEHESPSYQPRTKYNASKADLTVAFAVDLSTYGEQATKKFAGTKYIGFDLLSPSCTIENMVGLLVYEMQVKNLKTLNIAGNGIYTLTKFGMSQPQINQIVYEVIHNCHHLWPISKIYTGGQTGVDIAGAVAAIACQIPVEITFPKGFKQRTESGKDIDNTRESILGQLLDMVEHLATHNDA